MFYLPNYVFYIFLSPKGRTGSNKIFIGMPIIPLVLFAFVVFLVFAVLLAFVVLLTFVVLLAFLLFLTFLLL